MLSSLHGTAVFRDAFNRHVALPPHRTLSTQAVTTRPGSQSRRLILNFGCGADVENTLFSDRQGSVPCFAPAKGMAPGSCLPARLLSNCSPCDTSQPCTLANTTNLTLPKKPERSKLFLHSAEKGSLTSYMDQDFSHWENVQAEAPVPSEDLLLKLSILTKRERSSHLWKAQAGPQIHRSYAHRTWPKRLLVDEYRCSFHKQLLAYNFSDPESNHRTALCFIADHTLMHHVPE